MRTRYYGKDWSEKPTYAEVSYLYKKTLLFKGNAGFQDIDYFLIGSWQRIGAAIGYNWEFIFSNLYTKYHYIEGSPKIVQDWFTHVYHLGLMLEDTE
jgi:hypothetical protein